MPHEAHALFKLVQEFWTTGKPDLATEIFSAQAEHSEPGHEVIHGPKEIAHWASILHGAFPNFKLEITRTFTDANQFILCWTAWGTHKGTFLGVAPTGKAVEIHGVTIGRTSHGRIHDERLYYDRLAFLEQVGMAPAPAHSELAAIAH